MRVFLFSILACATMTVAHSQALPNLILAVDPTCDGRVNCGNWHYAAPANDKVYLVNGGAIFKLGSKILPTDKLQQCRLPVVPGQYSQCFDGNGVRQLVQIEKQALAWPGVDPPPPTTVRIKYTWKAPTLDDKQQPLASDEIVGYEITWWPQGSPSQTTVLKLGRVLEFILTAPRGPVCAALVVEGRQVYSDSTPTLCLDPTVPAPVKITPGPAQEFKGEVLPD